MFRSVIIKLSKINCRYQSSNRGGLKVLKFIPAPVKTSNKPKKELPPPTEIDEETIHLLEKLSLVGFENEKGIQIVQDAIQFADRIFEVDTKNVTPLISVLEDQALFLREDVVENDATREDVFHNTLVSEENYFVAPIGNIEYTPQGVKKEESSETEKSDLVQPPTQEVFQN